MSRHERSTVPWNDCFSAAIIDKPTSSSPELPNACSRDGSSSGPAISSARREREQLAPIEAGFGDDGRRGGAERRGSSGLEACPHQFEEVRIEGGARRARRQGVEPNSRCSRWIARDAQERGPKLDGANPSAPATARATATASRVNVVVAPGQTRATAHRPTARAEPSDATRRAPTWTRATAIARSAIGRELVDVPLDGQAGRRAPGLRNHPKTSQASATGRRVRRRRPPEPTRAPRKTRQELRPNPGGEARSTRRCL